MTKRRRDRFERFKIIFPILLAGWIPSILTLIVSYTILRDTLEFGAPGGPRSKPQQQRH